MPVRNLLLLLSVGAVGYLIVRRYSTSAGAGETVSPYAPVIEKVLHQHEGEDTPMVHAFEAALEQAAHA